MPGDAAGCKSSRHRPDRTKRVRQPLGHAKRETERKRAKRAEEIESAN
jgi:hypothetical protein